MSYRDPTYGLMHERDIVGEKVRPGYGSVYTRPWVAEFILDLSGYGAGENLVDAVAVEPSCGTGEFLEPMIRRLSASCRRQERPLRDCAESVQAFELDKESASLSRERAVSVLLDCGWEEEEAREVAWRWIRQTDFLLDPEIDLLGKLGRGVDFVVGNPPYIRLESIDPAVANHYRKLFRTMSGRADIYVGFYEKALELLKPGGVCGFICADRWMLNQYGGELRRLITGGFGVEALIEMRDAEAFHDEVLAYPAITIIRRQEQGKALVARIDGSQGSETVQSIVETTHGLRKSSQIDNTPYSYPGSIVVVDDWFRGSTPWPCTSPERLELLKHLEADFYPLEDASTGTRVGIGVATGADKVFITEDPELVEEERLLPLALSGDTVTGSLEWSGHYLVDPWSSNGDLVELDSYPLLHRYLARNEDLLKRRNVSKRNQERWFRTIDKVNHELTARPKLLIPDIKSVAHPVFDKGGLYPHHNLYYVTSETWDLKVLGGILLSKIGQFFIECYAVKMNGGYLRFQAQYLRRIRVPALQSIGVEQARRLSEAFEDRDVEKATHAALEVYGLERIPS